MPSRNYTKRANYSRRTRRKLRLCFMNMANNAYNTRAPQISGVINNSSSINNASSINQMLQIDKTQVTTNPEESSFYNGTNFFDNNSFESSFLPAGFSGTPFFP